MNKIRYARTKQQHFVFVLNELEVPMFDYYPACDFSTQPFDLDNGWTETRKAFVTYNPDSLKHEITYAQDIVFMCDSFEEINYASYVYDDVSSERSKLYHSIMNRIKNPVSDYKGVE